MIEPHTGWRKSTYSSTPGGNCVEVAAGWRKSSYSGHPGANCVEVANTGPTFAVRDSKDPAGPALTFSTADWTKFLAGLK